MAVVTEQPYDDFLALYTSLRALFSDDPQQLTRWRQTSPEQSQVLRHIQALTHKFRMQETFGGRRKVVEYVPSRFKQAWSDYLKLWSTFVDYCVGMKNGVDELFVFPPSEYADDILQKGETRFTYPLSKPVPALGSEFDPLVHDGRDIWEMTENLLVGQIEDDPALADDRSNRYSIACDYLHFLRADLRLDFAGIERRWRLVPLFLRPEHVVAHDFAAGLSLYHNLDNAVIAFIFGAEKAALALCRATLEMILRDFYVSDESMKQLRRKWRKSSDNEWQPSGQPLLEAASRDRDLIRENRDRIVSFKNPADTALHRGQPIVAEPMATEKDTAKFMELLAVLIQSAPER